MKLNKYKVRLNCIFVLVTQGPVTIYLEGGGRKRRGRGQGYFRLATGGGVNVCIKKFRGLSNRPLVTAVLLRAKTYHIIIFIILSYLSYKAGYRSSTLWPSDPDAKYQRSSGMRRK